MSILVVGSVAYDSISTPAGSRKDALGGSATYFSVSGSYFAPISVVAVVGDDFRPEHMELFRSHQIDTSGLEQQTGKSFRWSGVYGTEDLNTRRTLKTELNVFADFSPTLTPNQKKSPYVFLANIDPDLQLEVLQQVESSPTLVALDTMNFWIEGKNTSLRRVLKKVDVLFIDENEARELSNEVNLVKAARTVMAMGPSVTIIKRGGHGILLFHGKSIFAAPAYPLEIVMDPTGAGDSFAGGFLGYLDATGDLTQDGFRRAAVLGSVMGSFAVERFGLDRISTLSKPNISERFREFTRISQFSPLETGEYLPWCDSL